MDPRPPYAAVIEDITDQADALELQHDVVSTLSPAGLSKLFATSPTQFDTHKTLLVLETGLAADAFISDKATSNQIWDWIFDNVFGTRLLNDTYPPGKSDSRIVDHEIALRILLRLHEHDDSLLSGLFPIQISSLIICSTSSTSEDSRSAANELLSRLLHQDSKATSIHHRPLTTALLEDVVRPAFARSRSKNITTAGRKAIDPLPQALTASEDEKSLKPWKYSQRYVISILKWVLEHSSAKTIEDSWHLITPPLLTLIDDEATDSKIDGCVVLQILLDKVPTAMWTRTGLGKVFEDALNPILAYLPPLVEQNEAEKLIGSIYPTLLSLGNHQFPSPDQRVKKLAVLGNLMRAGVLSGLSHSGENVKISVLLLDQMCVILSQMEIYCVKHLQSIVPILVGYLCDPFAFASPVLLASVLTAFRCLITNAWPRIDRYSGELFKGIATCWQRLSEEPFSAPISSIQQDLKLTLQLLMKVLEGSITAKEMEVVLQNDEELSRMLS